MAFRPLPLPRRYLPWLAGAGLLLLAAILALSLLRRPLGPGTVLLGLLLVLVGGALVVVAYRLWALTTLDYWVERDAIRILWAGNTLIIPMGSIRRVGRATPDPTDKEEWRRWPAQWIRPFSPWRRQAIYATQPPSECLAIETRRTTYLLSPADAQAFVAAYEARQKLGALRTLKETAEVATYRRHWLSQERIPQILLVGGLALGLFFLAYTIWVLPTLPDVVPLHFDAAGAPDRVGAPRTLLLLPTITLLVGFFNAAVGISLYEQQRLAAYLLWVSAFLLQIVGFLAFRGLLTAVGG